MKTKLLLAISLFYGASLMAEDVDIVKFTATSAHNTTGDKVFLMKSSEFTTDFDNDNDITKKMGSAESPNVINFYAICSGWISKETKNASQAAVPNVDGQPFGFQSNKLDSEYTITFDILQGEPKWFFYDAQVDSATLITDGGTYVFNQAVSTTDISRFRIQAPAFQVCAYKNYVEVTGNEGTDNIVITTLAGDTVVNIAPKLGIQRIYLPTEAQPGHYLLTVNDTTYQFIYKPDELNGEE